MILHPVKLSVLIAFLLGGLFLCSDVRSQGFYFYNDRYMEPPVVLELGIAGGIMNCMTDIGGSKSAQNRYIQDVTFIKSHFSGGIYLAGVYKDFLVGRLEFNFGTVEAVDSLLKDSKNPSSIGRFERNLSFKSHISELAFNLELHPLYITDYVIKGIEPPRLSPYVYGGIGWMGFDPMANIDNRWVRLEPLRLEGQGFAEYPDRKRYKTGALCFPMGFGVKYEWTELLTLRLEAGRRITSTDYLDDASEGSWVKPELFYTYLPQTQADLAIRLYNRSPKFNPPQDTRPRGNSKEKDAFWTAVFKLGININRRNYR